MLADEDLYFAFAFGFRILGKCLLTTIAESNDCDGTCRLGLEDLRHFDGE